MAAAPPLAALREAKIGFGGRPTVTNASFSIARGERICLVGRNGSGKSSLLKALAGLIDIDSGERFLQPGTMVSYMPQDPEFDPTSTAAEYVALGLPHDEDLQHHGYKVDAMLAEVGISSDRKLIGLSGGEGRRVSLAQVFVGDPDVVLLDEPTNHLDIPAIEWLEERLLAYRGAILMISHDRAFLTKLSSRVLWLDRGKLKSLDQGYAGFDVWSEGVLAAEAAEQARLDKKIEVETVWSHQGISARRTRNMGRMRALQALRQERSQRVNTGSVKLGSVGNQSGGQLVAEAEHIDLSFPAPDPTLSRRVIVKDFSTRIIRGDRIGIVGPNGAGKSTLLKLLLGEIKPDNGKIRQGTNLMPAFLDQRRAGLDGRKSVWENLTGGTGDIVAVQGRSKHVVSYMRDFLFEDRQAHQPADSLSGGERNRLLLAKILAQESNLLVLDEPTNDLDMDTLDLLEEVLADYTGTLFLVSHDRDFIDRLVTSVIAVEGNGEVAEYVGGYSDYIRQRPPRETVKSMGKGMGKVSSRADKAKTAKLGFRDQHDLIELPKLIDKLSGEKLILERVLADAALYTKNPAKFATATARHSMVQTEIAIAEERWLELEMKRAELEGL